MADGREGMSRLVERIADNITEDGLAAPRNIRLQDARAVLEEVADALELEAGNDREIYESAAWREVAMWLRNQAKGEADEQSG